MTIGNYYWYYKRHDHITTFSILEGIIYINDKDNAWWFQIINNKIVYMSNIGYHPDLDLCTLIDINDPKYKEILQAVNTALIKKVLTGHSEYDNISVE